MFVLVKIFCLIYLANLGLKCSLSQIQNTYRLFLKPKEKVLYIVFYVHKHLYIIFVVIDTE